MILSLSEKSQSKASKYTAARLIGVVMDLKKKKFLVELFSIGQGNYVTIRIMK